MKKQQGMPGRGGWIFLAVVAACYGLVALLDGDRAAAALRLSARLMGEMAPVLGVVFVLRITSYNVCYTKLLRQSEEHCLHLTWVNKDCTATLNADLSSYGFSVTHTGGDCEEYVTSYR